jgi:hypothetical protein
VLFYLDADWCNHTLQMPGYLLESDRIAVDVKSSDIVPIGVLAQLIFEESGKVRGSSITTITIRITVCDQGSN